MNKPTPRRSLIPLLLAALISMTGPVIAQTSPLNADEPTDVTETPDSARPSPRYLLQNGSGRAVLSDDFRDRFQLIAFGFTSCPDVCPTTLLQMQQVMIALGERAKQVQPIFITVDPERDTGAVLDAYTHNFDARILGLTGSPELVRWAANNFKVKFDKVREPGAAPNIYTMDHTASLFLLGPDGQLLRKFVYGTPAQEVVTDLKRWMDLNENLPKQ